MKILIIGDSHSNPQVTQRRFHWLGKFIQDVKPDAVVDMGDWADNDSLSSYDRGKASFEGRRYAKDIEAAQEARDIVNTYIGKLARRPRLVALVGNHEARSDRYADDHPEMKGKIGSKDFKPQGMWEFVPFLKKANVGGFTFSHYIVSGVQERPIGGEHAAYTILTKELRSCIVAHSHLRDFCERTSGARRVQCLVAGCFVDPTWRPHYAQVSRDLWWSGLTVLDGVEGGQADAITQVGVRTLQKVYGR